MIRTIAYIGVTFILIPVVVIFISSFSELRYISFPPQGFTFAWYIQAIQRHEFLESFQFSLGIAALTTVSSLVIGTLTCFAMRFLPVRARAIAFSVVLSPLVLPGVVLGISLLQYFSLAGMGVSLKTLVIGHTVIAIPYVVRMVSDSLSSLPRNLEWAATSLGASPIETAFRVILPCIKPGLIGGAIFAFIISFENVTISVFLASPQITTLPVRIFGYTEQAIETWLIAICSMTIIFTILIIWIIQKIVGLQRIFYSGKT